MDTAIISGLAALSGSAIGGFASVAAAWVAHRHQDRRERVALNTTRRERFFAEFIDQASRTFADALVSQLESPSKLVPLYATIGKLRLFASPRTVQAADDVMARIVAAYYSPPVNLEKYENLDKDDYDVLQAFIDACHADLSAAA
ncbi:MAG TPA: hypothetical protein VKQ29_16095 [Aliidongia sp.]|nr:hypothetical protein [Aliidongia sp.]